MKKSIQKRVYIIWLFLSKTLENKIKLTVTVKLVVAWGEGLWKGVEEWDYKEAWENFLGWCICSLSWFW